MTPSTPASTDAGALAKIADKYERDASLYRIGSPTYAKECDLVAAALRNSAPQETRGDEPVAWTIPGDDTADCNGFIPTKVYTEGEFTKPLYAASQQSPRLEREALEAAERELTDLARPICCVYNRTAKKYEFTDAHIAQALPGTFEVIRQIRAALLSPDTTVVPSTERVAVDTVTIPKSAIDWLFGEKPDADGKWFGEYEDDILPSKTWIKRTYWWRSKFRELCTLPSKTQGEV